MVKMSAPVAPEEGIDMHGIVCRVTMGKDELVYSVQWPPGSVG